MESVINFLADNYIWFFVAAGLLIFALIGFIIDSKKKSNTFKGESAPVENNIPVDYERINVENNNVETPSSTEMQNVDNSMPNEPVNIDYTMEINDIPLTEPEEVKIEPTPINPELQNVPVDDIKMSEPIQFEESQPITNETPTFDTINDNNSQTTLFETPSIGETITNPANPSNGEVNSSIQSNNTTMPEENNNVEIFEELK